MGCTLLWSTELSEMDVCAEIVVEDVIAHLAKNHKKLVSAVGRPKKNIFD
jgi:hypothetical protein